MADSVVRLRIDSQEYDAKLKRAGDALSRYFDTVRKGGGTLEYLDDGVMDAVKALGEMETQANSAKGKIREYTEAITSLTAQYRQMSDAEKNGAIGKELKRSLDELKKKAADLNDVMADTNTEIKNLASDTAFSDGMSMMARSVGSVGTAIVALTGDSKEMKAVLMDIAKIQATVQAVESLTKAFQKQNLVLLKNPYVLVATAVAALGVAIYECANRADDSTKSMDDYRASIEKLGSSAEIAKYRLTDLINIRVNEQKINEATEEFNKQYKVVQDLKNKLSALENAGLAGGDVGEGLRKRIQKESNTLYYYQNLIKKYTGENSLIENSYKPSPSSPTTSTSAKTSNGRAKSTKEAIKKDALVDPSTIVAKMPTAQIAKEEASKYTTAYIDSLQSSFTKAMQNSEWGSNEFNAAMSHMVDATALANLIQTTLKNGINLDGIDVPSLIDQLLRPEGISNEQLQSVVDYINQFMGANPIKLNFDTGGVEGVKQVKEDAKETKQAWSAAASAVSQFGSALQQVEDPSAKIAGIIGQAVANIALGFAQATASPATGAAGVFGWIAAATAGLSTMAATIAAIKKTTAGSFANGGVIPGNSYSGDNQWAQVNAGEVILSRAQAGSVASQLESSEGSSQPHNSYISGEQIVTVVNAYGRRTGRGEILR